MKKLEPAVELGMTLYCLNNLFWIIEQVLSKVPKAKEEAIEMIKAEIMHASSSRIPEGIEDREAKLEAYLIPCEFLLRQYLEKDPLDVGSSAPTH